ncbi:MAG: hypothetical protein PHN44_01300 [Candidatus Marinimicrobia bacterium]|nr:hypothetical protein [Candidatus Neomarinimicrobiota bacterium]
MPIYKECQRIGESITGLCKKVTLKYSTDHWTINRWDGNGFITPSDQTKYIPEFGVRTMKVVAAVGSSAVVQYNLAGEKNEVVSESTIVPFECNIIDTFQALQNNIERVTTVWLAESSSTFTELVLGS